MKFLELASAGHGSNSDTAVLFAALTDGEQTPDVTGKQEIEMTPQAGQRVQV